MKQKTLMQICTVLLLTILSSQAKMIFIDFSQDTEAVALAKLFLNSSRGYYVDIGAFDPLAISNTADLYQKGWKGISLEADQYKFKNFKFTKLEQTKLHFAISNQSKMVNLYRNKYETTSTIDQKLQEHLMSNQINKKTSFSPVSSLTLRQLCQRYYLTSPKLLNLDIEGYGSIALLGNNWKNALCRPQIIFIEINGLDNVVNQQKKLKSPQEILKQNNYTSFMSIVGPHAWTTNQIYIQNEKLQNYKDSYQNSQKYFLQNYQVIAYKDLRKTFQRRFRKRGHTAHTFNLEEFYIDLCIQGKPVLIQEVIKFSKFISSDKERPIILLGFNQLKSAIWMGNLKYKKSEQKIEDQNYLKLEIVNWQGKKSEVFILDHRYGNILESEIITDKCTRDQSQKSKIGSQLSEKKETAEGIVKTQVLKSQANKQLPNKQIDRKFIENERLNQPEKQIYRTMKYEIRLIIILLIVLIGLSIKIIVQRGNNMNKNQNSVVKNLLLKLKPGDNLHLYAKIHQLILNLLYNSSAYDQNHYHLGIFGVKWGWPLVRQTMLSIIIILFAFNIID